MGVGGGREIKRIHKKLVFLSLLFSIINNVCIFLYLRVPIFIRYNKKSEERIESFN